MTHTMKSTQQLHIPALLCALLTVFALVMPSATQAQTSVCAGEEVCLTITARGAITWQQSLDSINWSAVPNGSNDTLCVFPGLSSWYRAEVNEGTCDPIWSDPEFIEVFPGIAVDAGPDAGICFGDSAALGGSPSGIGGTGTLTYAWTPAAGLSNANVPNPMASPVFSTDYVLTVTDSVGCSNSDTVSVTLFGPPVVDAGQDTTISCTSSVTLGGNPTASAGAGGYTYSWTPTNGLSSATVANPMATPGGTTSYICTVTDSLGCVGRDTVTITTTGQSSGTVTFAYTGAVQQWIVPASCVDSITADVYGAQGGSNWVSNDNFGGRVTADFAVNPGDTLWIYVGQQPTTTAGGWNGGGSGENAGKGGGGASDIRVGGQTLNDRLIVAGGGGGAGFWSNQHVVGGQGGGLSGTAGYRNVPTTLGGDPGTQTSSGNGTCVTFNNPSVAGGFGFGGNVSGCGCEGYGGGGGWYGGAGSGNCRGGGGGSGYTAPSAANVVHVTGVRTGNGQVIISW